MLCIESDPSPLGVSPLVWWSWGLATFGVRGLAPSPERLAQLRENDKSVLIYATADLCHIPVRRRGRAGGGAVGDQGPAACVIILLNMVAIDICESKRQE